MDTPLIWNYMYDLDHGLQICRNAEATKNIC